LENWSKKQEQIESDWRDRERERHLPQPITKLLLNRTSPFTPVFTRPDRSPYRGLGDLTSLTGKRYSDEQLESVCGSSGCGARPDVRSVEKIIEKQFQSWVIQESMEKMDFPPARIDYFPGALNIEALRAPLYNARNGLAVDWTLFWADCWEATPVGKNFDGCQAELRDYVVGSALEKASSKSYPTQRLAAEATVIATAIDAARRFHEATRELVPLMHPEKWPGTGVEFTHLEPDDLPPETRKAIQTADHELADAMGALRASFKSQR